MSISSQEIESSSAEHSDSEVSLYSSASEAHAHVSSGGLSTFPVPETSQLEFAAFGIAQAGHTTSKEETGQTLKAEASETTKREPQNVPRLRIYIIE